MSTAFPRTWITLLLESADAMERIAASAPAFREYASAPSLFQVAPGVLARFMNAPPARATLLPHFGASELPRAGATLELSGGDPETDLRTGRCSPNPLENDQAREMGASTRAMLRDP